jgi:hypothetical protein
MLSDVLKSHWRANLRHNICDSLRRLANAGVTPKQAESLRYKDWEAYFPAASKEVLACIFNLVRSGLFMSMRSLHSFVSHRKNGYHSGQRCSEAFWRV